MNHHWQRHPAIDAFQALRQQCSSDIAVLHFVLLQQLWIDSRGNPTHPASDYSDRLLQSLAHALLLSQGLSDAQIKNYLTDTMQLFESHFARLMADIEKDRAADRKMRRKRWPKGLNVVPFDRKKN